MSKTSAVHGRVDPFHPADVFSKWGDIVTRGEGKDLWEEFYAQGVTPWDLKTHNKSLVKHHDELLAVKGKDATVLIPCCGKCVELKWLYDEGYKVIGIELTELAVRQFFDEQQLKYQVVPVPEVDGFLYQTHDERLKIYACSFFNMNKNIVGEVDVVYDRAAFGAVTKDKRKKYVEVMKSLLAPDFRYLLIVYQYEDWYHHTTPYNCPAGLIRELFGTFCAVEERDRYDHTEIVIDLFHVNPTWEVEYFMTPK